MRKQENWEDKALWWEIRKVLRQSMSDKTIDRIYDVYHPLTKEA